MYESGVFFRNKERSRCFVSKHYTIYCSAPTGTMGFYLRVIAFNLCELYGGIYYSSSINKSLVQKYTWYCNNCQNNYSTAHKILTQFVFLCPLSIMIKTPVEIFCPTRTPEDIIKPDTSHLICFILIRYSFWWSLVVHVPIQGWFNALCWRMKWCNPDG